jgi:hypothetical protein
MTDAAGPGGKPAIVKHALPAARWPSEAEARASRWFSPVQLGPVTAHTRTWVPAMVPWRATDDGLVTDNVIAWYERFARGKPGVLVVEATGIRDVPSGPLLRIGHDRFVDGLRRLTEAVRKASGGETRLFLQILDFLAIRRRPEPAKFFARFLAITDRHRAFVRERLGAAAATTEDDVRAALATLSDADLHVALSPRERRDLDFGQREEVNDLHVPHIRDLPTALPSLCAAAAEACKRAGLVLRAQCATV